MGHGRTAPSSPATCRCSGSATWASTSGAWWPGRTQTWLHWYTRYSPEPVGEPRLWQRDVIRPDGTLFDPADAAVLRDHAGEDLALQPVPMTRKLMAHLEELGLIIRLRPAATTWRRSRARPSATRSTRPPTASARTS